MGISKTDGFTEHQLTVAKLAKAFGHPARVAIVEHLLSVNTCICGDIVNKLPLSQPTVSQHLKELKLAGIIQGTIEGNTICYCLNPQTLSILHDYFAAMQSIRSNCNSNC